MAHSLMLLGHCDKPDLLSTPSSVCVIRICSVDHWAAEGRSEQDLSNASQEESLFNSQGRLESQLIQRFQHG